MSKAEQKTTVVRYQTCYTNSTESSMHGSIWKNHQPPTVFLHSAKNHKYWTAARHYARYRSNTNNELTFFQKVLVFSDSKQSFKTCPIVLFGNSSAPPRRKLFSRARLSITEYKGHLKLKRYTVQRHIKAFCILYTAYRPQKSFK